AFESGNLDWLLRNQLHILLGQFIRGEPLDELIVGSGHLGDHYRRVVLFSYEARECGSILEATRANDFDPRPLDELRFYRHSLRIALDRWFGGSWRKRCQRRYR